MRRRRRRSQRTLVSWLLIQVMCKGFKPENIGFNRGIGEMCLCVVHMSSLIMSDQSFLYINL